VRTPGTRTLIAARGITVRFDGTTALQNVSFGLAPGEARGLVGENGAGKSTLIAVLSGALQPDEGTVQLDGAPVSLKTPSDALRRGIGTVHQQNWLVPSLTALGNVELGREQSRTPLRLLTRTPRAESLQALEFVGISDLAQRTAGPLSLAQRQLVAIARAFSRGSRLMIFDEPTAALSPVETGYLFDVIDRLKANGTALLYFTHRLEELSRAVDRISVMRSGEIVAETRSSVPTRELVELMAGRNVPTHEQAAVRARRMRTESSRATPVLTGRGLSDHLGAFRDLDIDIHAGEVVAVIGLPDSGAAEVTQCLAGARRLGSGTIEMAGRRVRTGSPRRHVLAGIGYMAGDRKTKGVIPNATVQATVTLTALRQISRAGLVRTRDEQRLAKRLLTDCRVTPQAPELAVTGLSGGNQQKALFARALATGPRVMVCEDPTAGVDPGGREVLYELLNELCSGQGAVVINSTDLREVALISDRALVMWRGRVAAELRKSQLTISALMRAQFNQELSSQELPHDGDS
jgi:ribose transport system ATP-binding protein